jgi:predicted Zn-dependent protease with MMP-like domain
VPIAHSRSQAFDAMVLRAVDHLRPRLAEQLAQVQFAVEDVPLVATLDGADFRFDDDVLDDNSVPLSRVFRTGVPGIEAPVIMLYRRPLESRAPDPADLADLVHDVVVEQIARLLGTSVDEVDPPPE